MEETSASDLIFRMGRLLLESGGEISRVQETMERVAAAFHVEDFDLYVLTNAIFATGKEKTATHRTRIKYVSTSSIHFGRISAINQLSREITAGEIGLHDAASRLQEIEEIPYTKQWKQILACGVGSAGFCFLFGGSIWDSLCALLCGFAIQCFLSFASQKKLSKFITNLLASGLAAAMGLLFFKLGLGQNLSVIITGSIIRLVPGIALTTSMRDFFNGDYLSGTIRLIDALIIGGCIALGVGVVLALTSMVLGAPVI